MFTGYDACPQAEGLLRCPMQDVLELLHQGLVPVCNTDVWNVGARDVIAPRPLLQVAVPDPVLLDLGGGGEGGKGWPTQSK